MSSFDFDLRIVPIDSVVPHEVHDPKRVGRLASSISKEGLLKNPPLVVEREGTYVILDGTTRTRAVKDLGLPHILVQVIPPDRVTVDTWHHLVLGMNVAAFKVQMNRLPFVKLADMSRPTLNPNGRRWGGNVYMVDGPVFGIEIPQECTAEEEIEALNSLVDIYLGESEIKRTIEINMDELKRLHPTLSAAVAFPRYSVEDLLDFGTAGLRVPPGLSRCIVPGRVLRTNIDTSMLASKVLTLDQKNALLEEYMNARMKRQPVRYYQEPVYIFED